MRLILLFSIFVAVFCSGCSGSYGVNLDLNTEKKVRLNPPHKDDTYERGTKETRIQYGFSQGFGDLQGGREYYSKESRVEYDSDDDAPGRIERKYKITYPD